jgi:purine-nucleoside phosphorylase
LADALGCRHLLITNAAGGIAEGMAAGDFLLVNDHLNMTGINPLRGRMDNPFVDLSRVYRHEFYVELRQSLLNDGISLHSGVLAWMPGPSYETPAEVLALCHLGAAAVSMSTIPEAVVARALGLSVVGLSLIANLAAGKGSTGLKHEEVLKQADEVQDDFIRLIETLLRFWPEKIS